MKRLSFLMLALSITAFSFAEEPATDTSSSAQPLSPEIAAPIGKRYIKDFILVPLRSGGTPAHRIVHKGIKSGTVVTLLKIDEASQYSLVKTSTGIEGWMPSHYLTEETPSLVKLEQAENIISKLSAQAGPEAMSLVQVQRQNEEILANIKVLEDTNNTLTRELEHVKSLAGSELKLNEDNKKLLIQYEIVKREKDTLNAENQSLKDQLRQNTFINGAIAVILGILATLIIQYFAKSKKRYSDWA